MGGIAPGIHPPQPGDEYSQDTERRCPQGSAAGGESWSFRTLALIVVAMQLSILKNIVIAGCVRHAGSG